MESKFGLEMGEARGIGTEQLDLESNEKKRRIDGLRAALKNVHSMMEAQTEPPKKRIVRKSHEEPLNMAQDSFLTALEFELTILLKSKIIHREDDIRRMKFYIELIHKMFAKKKEIQKNGEDQKFSEAKIFKNLRAQRRIDIGTLKSMIEIVEEIIKGAALELGEDFDAK